MYQSDFNNMKSAKNYIYLKLFNYNKMIYAKTKSLHIFWKRIDFI